METSCLKTAGIYWTLPNDEYKITSTKKVRVIKYRQGLFG